MVVDFDVVGFELDGPAIGGHGFVELAARAVDFTEVEMRGEVIRVEKESLANPLQGKVGVPGLMGDDSEEVERFDVVWLDRQDLAVERFSFSEAAGLMVLDGQCEGLRDSHCGGGRHDG
jgi:hypothetical protein